MNTREIILDILMEVTEKGAYSHVVLRNVLDKYQYLPDRDRAFIKRITEGTLEQMLLIDYILDGCSKVKVGRMKPLIRALLRMSVYQLLFMDSVPDSAVCNEAVKLAAKRGFSSLKGFVNGVLRGIARQKGDFPLPDREKEPERYLSVRYSMPEWIVRQWLGDYGGEETEGLLRELLLPRPLTVRLSRPGAADVDPGEAGARLVSGLESAGVKVEPHPFLPYAFILSGAAGVAGLPGYERGEFFVQDVSSMLAVEAAGIREGNFVLDVCAAPGGKTLLAAARTGAEGRVVSRDLTEYKRSLIDENANRLGYEHIRTEVWDAGVYDSSLEGAADVVLADLPCSGLGVIGRKPEIKYRITGEEIDALCGLQRRILDTVWRYVKPGGILLYSTCTIDRRENEGMTEWFLEEHPFTAEDPCAALPEALSGWVRRGIVRGDEGAGVQLMPHTHGTDGFFFARLKRNLS